MSELHIKLPLTPKVGVIEDNKFASWSGTHGSYGLPPTQPPTFKTDKMLSGSFSFDEMVLNRTVCAKMTAKNKSLVEFNKTNTNGLKKTMTRSNSSESFVHFKQHQLLMQQYGSLEQFRSSFIKYPPKKFKTSNVDVISVYDAELVVKDCLGDDAPEFILYKVRELCFHYAINGEVSWDDFCSVIELVDQAVDAESKIKRETPGLIILMNKPRTVDKNLIALGDLSSTYRDSFCGDDQLKYDERPQFHYERPEVECGGGSQLNKAARVLASGTLKSTYHIPGYRGHVPANIRNPKKYEHSQGRDVHPVYNNLVLSQRGMGCVLGYTGHVPIEPSDGQYHERKTACDPRTTTGAGFCGTRTML